MYWEMAELAESDKEDDWWVLFGKKGCLGISNW